MRLQLNHFNINETALNHAIGLASGIAKWLKKLDELMRKIFLTLFGYIECVPPKPRVNSLGIG